MTPRPHPMPTQPPTAAIGLPPLGGHLFGSERHASSREHRQLRRLSMHALERQLRTRLFGLQQVGERPVEGPD